VVRPVEFSQFEKVGQLASFSVTAHLALKINLADLERRYGVLRVSCNELSTIVTIYESTLQRKRQDDKQYLTSLKKANVTKWWENSATLQDDELTAASIRVQLGDALSFCVARVRQARRQYRLTINILNPDKKFGRKKGKRLRSRREGLKKQYYRYIQANLSNPSKRPKRFWTALGAIVSLVLTAYTQVEITALSNQVEGLASNQRKILAILKSDHSLIKQNENRIESLVVAAAELSTAVANVQQINMVQAIVAKLIEVQVIAFTDFDQLARALIQLALGQLSPELWEAQTLEDILSRLKVHAEEKGYKLAIDNTGDIFSLPMGYSIKNDSLNVYVKIPLTNQDILYSLFAFSSKPYYLGAPVDKHIMINPGPEYLAVSGSEGSYKLLTTDQINRCSHIKDAYFCPLENIIFHNYEQNCLSSLFAHKFQAASLKCGFVVLPDDQIFSRQLSQSKFIIHTLNPVHFRVLCDGEFAQTMQITGTQMLTFHENCIMTSQQLSIQGVGLDFNLLEEEVLIYPNMNQSLKETFERLQRNVLAIRHFEKDQASRPLSVDDVLARYDISEPRVTPIGFHLPISLGGGALFFAALGLTVICVVYMRYRNLKNKKRAPPVRMGDLTDQ